MVNPFDLKAALLAKHAQQIVLIHFPIALFLSAVGFDLIAQWTKRRGFADTAYYNLVGAASFDIPRTAYRLAGLAFSTGRTKIQGHSPRACGACLRRQRNYLAGVVVTFSYAAWGKAVT